MFSRLCCALLTITALYASSGCTAPSTQTDSQTVTELPFPDNPDLWPSIRQERIRTLLGPAMARAGVDAWIVLARENANDPIASHLGAENAGSLAAFLFFADAEGNLESLAISPETEATALSEVSPLDDVRSVPRGTSMYTAAADELRNRNPRSIAVNSSNRNIADGLSYTQRVALEEALGSTLSSRLVSSEEIVIEWLSVKLPQEVEICLLYTSPSPRDGLLSRMPSSA